MNSNGILPDFAMGDSFHRESCLNDQCVNLECVFNYIHDKGAKRGQK